MSPELNLSPALPRQPAQPLRVYLLGPLRIEQDATPITFPRRKVESLFAYLLLHREQQTRDSLATRFWGDTADDKARHSLRTALATLRQQLGDSLLIADREHVQINPDFALWVDLRELLAMGKWAVEIARSDVAQLQALVALWQGELLAGFYDDWVTAEREHYQERLLRTLLDVTQALRSLSEYSQAIEIAQKILSFDPANELAHQHLMFCYMAGGDRAAALRQYELCELALERELDASPLPATSALYHWIKRNNAEDLSMAARITNLPIPLTSFVGRTQQSSEVKQLLNPQGKRTRLLTLTGAGGSGKTRLSIQVATDLIDSFAHGVWWVELAALSEAEQVARAVAKALGVNEVRAESCLQSVNHFLAEKHLLLVLDNCEHLIDASAKVAAELLSHCPNLQILTTSRESLNMAGEVVWQVPTLALPEPQQVSLLDILLQHECIRLFYERAIALQPDFRLTLENAAAVVEICSRLDGIPLAIELAAARVKVLPVEQIAARLSSSIGARFALLTQGGRTVQPRQQTLRAAIDWSYDLLDAEERQLFRAIAIFRGGFTLEALENIAHSAFRTPHSAFRTPHSALRAPLDLLTQLVDKSLVIVEWQGNENRYRMLETLREYALDQGSSSHELQKIQQCHAEFFLNWAERAAPKLTGIQQQEWLNQIEIEHPNLRAALEYLIEKGAPALAQRLAVALFRFWGTRGYLGEGREWFQKVLRLGDGTVNEAQAKALNAAGHLAYRQGDFDQAMSLFKQSLEQFQQIEDEIGIVDVLQNMVNPIIPQGQFATAQGYVEQSLALSRRLHYDYGIARAMQILGNLAYDQDKISEACDYFLEALTRYRALGDQVGMATMLLNLGTAVSLLGDKDTAHIYQQECLNISRAIGHKGLISTTSRALGLHALAQNHFDQARSYAEESLKITLAVGDRSNSGFALLLLGDIAHAQGQVTQALSYYLQNLEIMVAINYRWPIYDVLEKIARLLTDLLPQPAHATLLFGAAQVIRQEVGTVVSAADQAGYDQRLLSLRQQLGDTAFETEWQQGQRMSLEQIVALVRQLTQA